jgi:hypothetical protein
MECRKCYVGCGRKSGRPHSRGARLKSGRVLVADGHDGAWQTTTVPGGKMPASRPEEHAAEAKPLFRVEAISPHRVTFGLPSYSGRRSSETRPPGGAARIQTRRNAEGIAPAA